MITQKSESTYYIYRGRPQGFEYELAAEFADFIGVDLEVVTPGWMEMFAMLEQGRGDFLAAGVAALPAREKRMHFSDPYLTVRQEVIVRHDRSEIKTERDLDGKTVHVRAGTSFQETLAGLLGEGVRMELVLAPDVSSDELIRQVADGEIDATVTYSNVALGNRIYYPEVKTAFPISRPLSLAWAVRKGDRDLLEAINDFLTMVKIDGTLDDIYMRYFGDRDHLNTFDLKAFHRGVELDLPQYRGMVREAARDYGFDWRLIAAMMYQESQFDPDARSHTGVRGLMQVTQRTAEDMGIEDRMDPEQSIRAGVGYLASLYDWFDDIEDEEDRLRFALASYNVGYGHVRDAQDILRERGEDTQSWSSLRESLPLLRMPEFYSKTRFGYARGTEPVRYVENVLTYYDILKKKI